MKEITASDGSSPDSIGNRDSSPVQQRSIACDFFKCCAIPAEDPFVRSPPYGPTTPRISSVSSRWTKIRSTPRSPSGQRASPKPLCRTGPNKATDIPPIPRIQPDQASELSADAKAEITVAPEEFQLKSENYDFPAEAAASEEGLLSSTGLVLSSMSDIMKTETKPSYSKAGLASSEKGARATSAPSEKEIATETAVLTNALEKTEAHKDKDKPTKSKSSAFKEEPSSAEPSDKATYGTHPKNLSVAKQAPPVVGALPLVQILHEGLSDEAEKLTHREPVEVPLKKQVELAYDEAISRLQDEQLLRPKVLIDAIHRKLDVIISRKPVPNILVSPRDDSISEQEAREIKDKITEDKRVQTLNVKFDMLMEAIDFFQIESVLEGSYGLAASPSAILAGAGMSQGSGTGWDGSTNTNESLKTAKHIGRRRRRDFLRRSLSGGSKLLGMHKRRLHGHDVKEWIEDNRGGLHLKYRTESNGSISVKVKGKLRCDLLRVLAIISEIEFHPLWMPFVKETSIIEPTSRCSQLAQCISEYPWPIRLRESILYSFGFDALEELNAIILLGKSPPAEAKSFLGVTIPPPPKKITRVPCNYLFCMMRPLEHGAATTLEVQTNIDTGLNLRIVSGIIAMVVKKSVRGFYAKIVELCAKFEGSAYERRVAENTELYGWARRKLNNHFTTEDPVFDSMMTLANDAFDL